MFKKLVDQLYKAICIFLILLSGSIFASPVIADNLRVPVKLDYPLLRELMLKQLFKTPDKRVEILNDPRGCNRIYLSDPQLRTYQKKLVVTAHVRAKLATAVFGNCTQLLDWEGDARFLTQPVIAQGGRSVRLNILQTQLYNTRGQAISGPIWDLAKGHLPPLVKRYRIDLSPTIDQLGNLLADVLPHRSGSQIKKVTDSLSLSAVSIAADGIDVALNLQIDRLPVTPQTASVLSAKEAEQLESKWQMMDAMVTFAVKHYAKETHQQDLRDALAELLLDARYRLHDVLVMPVSEINDPVRLWFIDVWQRLGPMLRKIHLENPGQEPMLLLSLLTATDALDVLDRMGPAIGLDISANGLRRMGRMLINNPNIDPLHYDDAVDPELRQLFGLPPTPASDQASWFSFNPWPLRSARANTTKDRLHLWAPSKSELPEYLPIIRDLLTERANRAADQFQLDASVTRIFRHLVLTTAWQESCWRQYEIKNRKVVTLRSYSGDTGLMQINEQVWRGLYDTQKLRWDIDYNARAGVEVLSKYLVKYALKRGEQKQPGGLDNLARSTYSAYNGGPSQTSRYRNAKAAAAFRKIDAAFWNKYQAVKQGKELQVSECLGVDMSTVVASSGKKPAPETVPAAPEQPVSTGSGNSSNDRAWILAQNGNHFTLQLATFSSYQAAQKFIADYRIAGAVTVATVGKDKKDLFVVLKGSFENRAEADKLKQQYQKLKPWVRQFKDIRASLKG